MFSKLNLDLNFVGNYAAELLKDFVQETGCLLPRSIANCMTSIHFAAGRDDIREMFKSNSVPHTKKKKRKRKGKKKKKKK